jgi:hypothetical protein
MKAGEQGENLFFFQGDLTPQSACEFLHKAPYFGALNPVFSLTVKGCSSNVAR